MRWSDHVHLTPDRPFSSEVDTGCGSGMASASVGHYLREGDRPMRRQLDRIDDDHACGAGKEEAPVRRGMNSPPHLPPPTAISPARDRLLVSLKCNGRFSIETNDSGTTAPGSGVHVRLSPSLPPSLSLRGCRLGRYASPDGVFDGVAFDLCVVDFRARDCGCAAVWHHQFTT